MATTQQRAKHAGYKDAVNLTISLCLTYSLCIAAVRVWIRKGMFGVDDLVIAVATILTLCHTACDYASLVDGLGLPWARLQDDADLQNLDQASVAGVVLFLVALYLSKCAMLAFLSRITKTRHQIIFYHTCNAVVAVLGLASVLIATVNCPTVSGYYWAFSANQASCSNQSRRWQTITALDLLTEVLLLVLPIQLIWGLHMPFLKKVMLIMAFSLRLPVLGISIGRNYYTMQLAHSTSDAGLDAAIVAIWLEVQLAYALAASTLSALKTFTEDFNSGFGQGFTRGKGDGSYGLSHLSASSKPDPGKPHSHALVSTTELKPKPCPGDDIEVHSKPCMDRRYQPPPPLRPLRIRPETSGQHSTEISAEPWHVPRSAGSDDSIVPADDLVIVRGQTYEIHHDQAPIWTPWRERE